MGNLWKKLVAVLMRQMRTHIQLVSTLERLATAFYQVVRLTFAHMCCSDKFKVVAEFDDSYGQILKYYPHPDHPRWSIIGAIITLTV